MTPDEANILRYLDERPFASTHTVARHFRWGLPAAELRLRSLLAHGHVEEDARRYYRITQLGTDALTGFDDHWKIVPFDKSRRLV